MSATELALAAAVMAVGATVQGSIGFGLNVVAAPFLVLIDTRLVPGPALIAGTFLVAMVWWRERDSVDLRGLGWAFAGRLPGVAIGAYAISVLPEAGVGVALALLVLVAVIISAAGWTIRRTRPAMVGAGVASGIMGTVASIGGPPIALTYQDKAGHEIRGTLSAFFFINTWFSFAGLAIVGRFGADEIRNGLALVPGLIVGFIVSRWAARYIDRGYTRPAVLGLSAAAAIGALVRYAL